MMCVTAGLPQGLLLEIQMLILRRDPGIADVHDLPLPLRHKTHARIHTFFTLFSYCVSYPNFGAKAIAKPSEDARHENPRFLARPVEP